MKKIIISIAVAAVLSTASFAQASESFGGFGISVYPGKKGASVAAVLPNSPAEQAGLQAGDVRALISVQDLESQDVSAWLGKNKSISVEELNYLASQKIGDGYEFLGLTQKGLLINPDMENLNLPAGSYHAKLEVGSAVLAYKFELR